MKKLIVKWLLKLLGEEELITIEPQSFNAGDVIFIRVDIGNMSVSRAEAYMIKVKKVIKKNFKDNNILVMPHSTSIEVIKKKL